MTDPASGSAPELRARIEAKVAEWRERDFKDGEFGWPIGYNIRELADELEALLQVSEPPRCERCEKFEALRDEWYDAAAFIACLDRGVQAQEPIRAVSERCECPVGWPKRGKVTSHALKHTGPCQLHDEIENWMGTRGHGVGVQAQEPRCDGFGWIVDYMESSGMAHQRRPCPGCVACEGES